VRFQKRSIISHTVTEGFTLVLAGAKDFIEHNIILSLISDHLPNEYKTKAKDL